MDTFNTFNVINHLKTTVENKYNYEQSELNRREIKFSNQLLNKIEYYIHSINDFIDGHIEPMDTNINDNKCINSNVTNVSNDPDYIPIDFKLKVYWYLIKLYTILYVLYASYKFCI